MAQMIDRTKLLELLRKNSKAIVVDVLKKEQYDKEHIKGAISIPLDDLEMEAPEKLDKDDMIIVYCASFECPASTQAAQKLEEMGYNNVYDYKGGIKDYKEAGLAVDSFSYHK
jgi:rhodanese-related sulfurtransferase